MTKNRIEDLLEIMRRLRSPEGGCPWDLEQDFRSIAPYTIEEAYEVADAIEHNNFDELRDELGDLLFQVVFHAQMANEQGAFDFNDVLEAIVDKMIRRHPHVFGEAEVSDAEDQTAKWEAQKAAERAAKAEGRAHSALDGVSRSLPALTRAGKLQRRAARVGFDWPDFSGVLDKLLEEIDELHLELAEGGAPERVEAEMGDLLFTCVNLARHINVDPESALRSANARFEHRFRQMETQLAAQGQTAEEADADTLDQHWEAAKQAEKP